MIVHVNSQQQANPSQMCKRHVMKQLRLKAEQAARDRLAEERAIATMRANFAEDERREAEAQSRRQQATAAHEQALRAQLAEAQRRGLEAREAERAAARAVEQQEALRQRVVAEARRRLLAEHAVRLHGYLSPELEAEARAAVLAASGDRKV